MSGKHLLDDLCRSILGLSDFIDEHLYEFCTDNRMYSVLYATLLYACSYEGVYGKNLACRWTRFLIKTIGGGALHKRLYLEYMVVFH